MVPRARPQKRRALIVGAGPGGLTAAAALRRAGFDVTVCERAAGATRAGSGLTLWPNASRALDRLGLLPRLAAITRPLTGIAMRNWRDRVLLETELADLDGGERFCSVGLLRAELIHLLSARVADAIVTGAHVVDLQQHADFVTMYLADGRQLSAEILIAADGLHSTIRNRYVAPDPLRYAGYTVWRGIAHIALAHQIGTTWMGPGKQFGLFPLAGARAYWFACLKAWEGAYHDADDPRAALVAGFADGPQPIARVLRATENAAILRTDIFDRAPLQRWSFGRVALLGDAAHPSEPTLGQGACQAIEDGVVLGACLADTDDAGGGLRRYQAQRLRRANDFARQARRIGNVGLWEGAIACRLRDLMISGIPASMHRRQFARMFSFPA